MVQNACRWMGLVMMLATGIGCGLLTGEDESASRGARLPSRGQGEGFKADSPAPPAASDDEAEATPGDTDEAPATSPAPGETEMTPADPVPEGSFAVDTQLLAIADLNVREAATTDSAILTTIPAGTRVKVVTISGADGWVNVTYDGKTGFSTKQFLSVAKYSAERGKKMADRALALWDGKPSRDLCLAGVDDAAETSGAIPTPPGWIPRKPSAVAWQAYANESPLELLSRGYVRETLGVSKLPKGAIIGWRGGQCGYSGPYGHIEIVVDDQSSRACSDYCGAIKKDCGDPFVYVPIEM